MELAKPYVIDAVVNIWTKEALRGRPDRKEFYTGKVKVDRGTFEGVSLKEMIERMDRAGIERSMLIAAKVGPAGHRACYTVPHTLVVDAIQKYPDRFLGLAGVDPTEGMTGVRELVKIVREYGFIGAHSYPHWFELAPDHARYYPFYAKCVELDVPMQLQVGQSLIYDRSFPRRSVGRPITLDSVACDFPELTVIGIHIGIPWADEMIAMAWKHSNVFIGSDAHAPRYWPQTFVNYINSYGQDKVIFGTDFPVLDFGETLKQIDALNLRETPKRKLLRGNALRIYKLAGDP